jgi:NTP pyrophosphatase (non-canonical NTP hydrolase)
MKMEVRQEVKRFAEVMERKLQENDHKGGWRGEHPAWLLGRLLEEISELEEALRQANRRAIERECADIANFAMMIADQTQDQVERIVSSSRDHDNTSG